MEPNEPVTSYCQRVEMALIHHLGARGDTLKAKISSVANELPEPLAILLTEIAGSASPTSSLDSAAELAFRCGQAVERIEDLARQRAAEDLIFTDSAGHAVTDPEKADLDTLSRFRAARDRFLRKAADFSLKLLAVLVLLTSVAFLIGII